MLGRRYNQTLQRQTEDSMEEHEANVEVEDSMDLLHEGQRKTSKTSIKTEKISMAELETKEAKEKILK